MITHLFFVYLTIRSEWRWYYKYNRCQVINKLNRVGEKWFSPLPYLLIEVSCYLLIFIVNRIGS